MLPEYKLAIFKWSKSLTIIPAEGLAFFISAIKETLFNSWLLIKAFLKFKKLSIDFILFSIDHGPQGGDEINLNFFPQNNKLKNYGWPIASYGEHYGGKIDKNKKKYEKAPLLKSHEKNGFIEPHKFFVPSIAPSDILNIPKKFDKNLLTIFTYHHLDSKTPRVEDLFTLLN